MSKKMVTVTLFLLLVIACALPFVLTSYRTFQATLVLVYAIALLGLNILTGYNGQISLGHGAFYAIGAYSAAVLMDRFGAPYWATLPAAGAVCLATNGNRLYNPRPRGARATERVRRAHPDDAASAPNARCCVPWSWLASAMAVDPITTVPPCGHDPTRTCHRCSPLETFTAYSSDSPFQK